MRPGSPREHPSRDDYRPPAQFLVHVAAMCAAVPPPKLRASSGLESTNMYSVFEMLILNLFVREREGGREGGMEGGRERNRQTDRTSFIRRKLVHLFECVAVSCSRRLTCKINIILASFIEVFSCST